MFRLTVRRGLSAKASATKVTQTKLIIDGKLVNSVSGRTFDTINPANGKVICAIQEGGVEDINLAVKSSRKAFDEGAWPRMSGRDRGKILFKFADLLEKHGPELAALETMDNGEC